MYGFVYIWYDKKHKRYYIGSHKGHINDGYICSSSWMKKAYKRRPYDFKRKIISFIKTDRDDLLKEEQRFLNMIKDNELGKKYYNLKKNAYGGFTSNAYIALSKATYGKPLSENHKKAISKGLKNKKWSEKRRNSQCGNYKQKKKLMYEHNGIIIGNVEESIKYANISKSTLNRWADNNKNNWRKIYVE